ncbi:hypothetical protein PYW07_015547 [Mythimna separata]|uniref:Uncharacterized protein n=1 Tax=Mythimna separata TaxID=271217 RepID=A0AAD8DYP1_MYTSE|nr:hypothetical protein PYW07_015547 [Mythimna separata]
MKKAYGTKSDINQYTDIERMGKVYPRRKSRKETLKSKSVQYKDYTQQKHNRRKERNNVRFCNNVNCLEYYDGQGQKVRGRGDGDAEKRQQYGSPPQKTTAVENCLCDKGKTKGKKKSKKKKIKTFIDKCYCKLKKKGKKLKQKESLETITPDKKICKRLARAEREMETIMPYSKRKFKKTSSQPVLENKDKTCLCPLQLEHTDRFNCECDQADKCPVCRAKEAGIFDRKKMLKHPCTCMEEPKKVEEKKDLSKCPMCKENYKKNVSKCPCCKKPFASGGPTPDNSAAEKKKLLDLTKPLFQMTVNKTNMRIVNKDEVIKKMGSSAKAMQKAQKAIEQAKYHSSSCKCCICRLKKSDALLRAGASLTTKPRKLKPCICGSPICKKDWLQLKRERRNWELQRSLNLKRCVCGSNICGEESQKMPEVLLEAAKQADYEQFLAKQAIIKEKQYQKARKKRQKEREKSLKQQSQLQRKFDRRQMKFIRENTTAGSISLVAESFIDLGTFGSKAFCDVAKYIYKGIKHPRDAIQDIRDVVSEPGRAAGALEKHAVRVALSGTVERIQERLKKMPIQEGSAET